MIMAPAIVCRYNRITDFLYVIFFRFLYCDDVNISTDTCFSLIYSAKKYQIGALEAKCVGFMERNLNDHTAASFLDQAVFFNEEKLIQKCLGFLSTNASRKLKTVTDYHVSKETLKVIVNCELIICEVYAFCIFEICNSWADVECENKGLDKSGQNKRDLLGSIVSKIQFHSMTNEEIASAVSKSGLLTMQEELEVFRFINTKPQSPMFWSGLDKSRKTRQSLSNRSLRKHLCQKIL